MISLRYVLVVPMKTTWTLAKAAVAPNTSILLALVATDIKTEKRKLKTHTRARRLRTSCTKKRAMMDTIGMMEDTAEPMISNASRNFRPE